MKDFRKEADQKKQETIDPNAQRIVDLIKAKLDGIDGKDYYLDAVRRTITIYLYPRDQIFNFDDARHVANRILMEDPECQWSSIEMNNHNGLEFEIVLKIK